MYLPLKVKKRRREKWGKSYSGLYAESRRRVENVLWLIQQLCLQLSPLTDSVSSADERTDAGKHFEM